jgi:hypothetical protein
MYKLFMEFENPTPQFVGERRSIQGFAIHGDTAFVLFHTGVCAAYDLVSRDSSPLGVFKLGSYNDGDPDKRYINHANDAMFGPTVEGEEFPLLYVTAGNSGESDERGYIGYCAVEQIRRTENGFCAQTVSRIYYKNDGIECTPYQAPGWGWPASLVDVEGGYYYMLSAKYRTKKEFYREDQVYIVTKFALPDPQAGDVTLYPRDIIDQFELPFDIFITQGGTLKDGKIWYLFGFGREEYPDALRVIDLERKSYYLSEDLSTSPFGDVEVECCAFYKDKLLINTQDGKIYERE